MAVIKVHPTRINLIRTKKTLKMAESGYDVLEKKRDVLIRELRHFVYDAKKLREEIIPALTIAFQSLRDAKVMMGPETVENIALSCSFKENILLDQRSIMGVTVPIVKFQKEKDVKPDYGFADTSASLDRAFKAFYNILELIVHLAETEGIVFQIANDVEKTQKRVNALEFVFIPRYMETVKHIELVLEEKEREEFVRMKMAKKIVLKREHME